MNTLVSFGLVWLCLQLNIIDKQTGAGNMERCFISTFSLYFPSGFSLIIYSLERMEGVCGHKCMRMCVFVWDNDKVLRSCDQVYV